MARIGPLFVALLLAATAGCGSSSDDAGVADDAAELVGSWEATTISTGSGIESVLGGSTLTADFDGEGITGNGGCNGFNGSYTTSGTTIDIGPLASTMMACADPARQTQEQRYLAALELATSFRVARNRLELFRDGGSIAATFEPSTGGEVRSS